MRLNTCEFPCRRHDLDCHLALIPLVSIALVSMQTAFNAVLYATTPEMFPAYVRGTACGTASMFGRLSGIVAPFAGEKFIANSSSGILWVRIPPLKIDILWSGYAHISPTFP